ncbi:Kelch-like protein 10, partial [Pseudolycoriella hygida]
MPIIKSRGKSAHHGSGVVGNQSLLKIESVVPTTSRNPSKSIYRSYSTLSSGYFKKINETKAEHDQRKSNSNNVQNGFWRIQRSSKEREKLPDRINLDRRGLTSLPVIEDEPNLRLLSLQHNLINVFHVPGSHKVEKVCVENKDGTSISSTEPKVKRLEQMKASPTISTKKPKNFIQRTSSSRNLCLNGSVVNKLAPNSHPLPQPTTQQNQSVKNSFIQKSVFLHAKERYVLKKSNSFINNYSQHLAATKAHIGRLMQARLNQSSSDSTQEPDNKSTNNGVGIDSLVVKNELQTNFADSLQNLVFLDLYDNQIDKISSLDGLKSLTVLLLGKNRISDITGIVSVKNTLRVLDLHGNKITNITQKISQLQELKSLNLAGNSLKGIHADDFKGLFNLREVRSTKNSMYKYDGVTLYVHSPILSACSEFFQTAFYSKHDTTSATDPVHVMNIRIPGVSCYALTKIIEYSYLRTCELTEKNVCEILVVADYVAMFGLVELCVQFLTELLKPTNCISIMRFALLRKNKDLHQVAQLYVLRNFEDVAVESEELLQMSSEELGTVLANDFLNVKDENLVWKCILHWIDYDAETRKGKIADLLPCIRLGCLNPS